MRGPLSDVERAEIEARRGILSNRWSGELLHFLNGFQKITPEERARICSHVITLIEKVMKENDEQVIARFLGKLRAFVHGIEEYVQNEQMRQQREQEAEERRILE